MSDYNRLNREGEEGQGKMKNKCVPFILNILDVFSVIFRLLGIVSIIYALTFITDPDADGSEYVVLKNTWPLFGIILGYLIAFATRYFGAALVLFFFVAKLSICHLDLVGIQPYLFFV